VKELKNKEDLIKAVDAIASGTSSLAKKIIGRTFPIMSLTVFTHSEAEFELLNKVLDDLGKPYDYNNGPRVELYSPIIVDNNQIKYLRIRKPDVERSQMGCNDFETNYMKFKNKYLSKYPNNLRLIKRPEYEMIELYHPEFDVLAYIVSD